MDAECSGRGAVASLREWRAAGYRIRLDFLWIPNPGITNVRVMERVTKGGDNIPEDVQLRRFHLGIRNLAELYRPLIDNWRLYDNTGDHPFLTAEEEDVVLRVVEDGRLQPRCANIDPDRACWRRFVVLVIRALARARCGRLRARERRSPWVAGIPRCEMFGLIPRGARAIRLSPD